MLLFLFSSQPPTETLCPETGPVWGEGERGPLGCAFVSRGPTGWEGQASWASLCRERTGA